MEEEEGDKPTTTLSQTCTILSIDHTNLWYRVCAVCERTINTATADAPSFLCQFCNINPAAATASSSSKRLFRILMSVATDTKVITVICFDRVARVMFGCSADEFFDFAKLHPFSGVTVNEILEGEMFSMTLSKPKNGNAQHTRVTSAVPLSSTFQPAIQVLRDCYGPQRCS